MKREYTELRSEYSKTFSDGRERRAVIYPMSVHYEKDGSWEEIDNRLKKNEGTGSTWYENAGSPLKVKYAVNGENEDIVRLEYSGNAIGWSFVKALPARGYEVKVENGIEEEDSLYPENYASRITYSGITEGMDAVYVLEGYRCKETIILGSADAREDAEICIRGEGLKFAEKV